MTIISRAQNFEDVLLWRALGDVENGCYIDIGAQDPIADSVSLAFYDQGWRGVHAEATAAYADRLRQARPDEIVVEAAVTDSVGLLPFYEIEGTGISTGDAGVAASHRELGFKPRLIHVPTVRLEALFDLVDDDIHWLKIDVEGMEPQVLRSWGDHAQRPWVLVVEATYPNSQEPTEHLWIDELLGRGYSEVFFDGLSRYFIHESHDELRERLTRPANVFDGYSIEREHFSAGVLRRDIEALEGRLRDLQTQDEQELSAARALFEQAQRDGAAAHDRASAIEAEYRTEVASLMTRQDTARHELQARIDALVESLREAEERGAIARVEVAQLGERSLQLAEQNITITNARDELAKARDDALAETLTARIEIGRHEERQDQLQKQNAALGRSLEDAKSEATRARIEIGRLEERQDQLQQRTEELANSLEQSTQAEAAARNEATLAQQGAQETAGRLATVEADVDALRDEIERLNRDLTHARRVASHARGLLKSIDEEAPSRWTRVGQALRLQAPSPARNVVTRWLIASHQLDWADVATALPTANASELNVHELARDDGRNPYLRANSLGELLSWNDVDFVRCAYVTVLGRQPDPEGESHFTSEIRAGASKLDLLWRLRQSPEGPLHDPGISGLDRVLKRAALERRPLLGVFVRQLRPSADGNSRNDRALRSLMNTTSVNQRLLRAVDRRLASVEWSLARSMERGSVGADPGAIPESVASSGVAAPTPRLLPELKHLRRQAPLARYFAKSGL